VRMAVRVGVSMSLTMSEMHVTAAEVVREVHMRVAE